MSTRAQDIYPAKRRFAMGTLLSPVPPVGDFGFLPLQNLIATLEDVGALVFLPKVGTPKTTTFCYWAYLILLD